MKATLYNIQKKLRKEYNGDAIALTYGDKSKENLYRGFFSNLDVWLSQKSRHMSTIFELAALANLSFAPAIYLLKAKAQYKYPRATDLAKASGLSNATLSSTEYPAFYSDPVGWADGRSWRTIEKIIQAVED